jgi:hypothetical protein
MTPGVIQQAATSLGYNPATYGHRGLYEPRPWPVLSTLARLAVLEDGAAANLSVPLQLSPLCLLQSFVAEALLWFAVTWEVFRQTFPRGLAPRRIAAGVLISVLFLLALVFYFSGPQPGAYFIADFVRKIALSVAAWLLVVLALARYYGMSVGRNIWGMAVGLLVVVSAHIANFAAVEISPSFSPIWSLLVPFGFTATLVIWTVTMWSYAPNPRPVAPGEPLQREAVSYWEERWAALGMTVRKAFKP